MYVVFAAAAAAGILLACGGALAVDDLQFEPKIVDFGEVPVGQTAEQTVRLTNTGSGTLENMTFFVDSEFGQPLAFEVELLTNADSVSLGPGETLEAVVRFRPEEPRDYVGYFFAFTSRRDDEGENAYFTGRGATPTPSSADGGTDAGM